MTRIGSIVRLTSLSRSISFSLSFPLSCALALAACGVDEASGAGDADRASASGQSGDGAGGAPGDAPAPHHTAGAKGTSRAAADAPQIWTPGNKEGFGTAMSADSKVWYTLQGGRLSEVYYPDLGTPSVRTLELVVGEGEGAAVVSESSTHAVRLADADSLTYQQEATDKDGRWRVTATYVTDPARSSLLVDVRLESLDGAPHPLSVSYDPSLANDGLNDTGWAEDGALLAADSLAATALLASPAFTSADGGAAGPADVVQTGVTAVDGVASDRVTLSLGFAADADHALATAKASLGCGFDAVASDYADGWHAYLASLSHPPASLETDLERDTYRVSTMVLAASEDKTYPGAYIASPTMAWVWGNGLEAPSGAYHLVWSRDLYEIATALIAQGDVSGAGRALDYLFETQQKDDGSFPQNSLVDGTPHWGSLQLDEVADPIILAHQLGRDDAATWSHVKPAADFLVGFTQEDEGQSAPWSPQERWENQSGFSPATIASEIAALVCAAQIALANGDAGSADLYMTTARAWRDQVDSWTLTTSGPHSSEPYYLRLTKDGDPDSGTMYSVGDGGPSAIDQRAVVDPSFLELVRLGIKDPHDPAILSSLPVVDAQLMVETPSGKFWHRYNFDGYGETAAGGPWDVSDPDTFGTFGRAWPIFAGERGEYELAAGNEGGAREALAAMALSGGGGLLLPEQVWDAVAPSGE
ncbi:MAG TPA: glycoside hydrolase family 15 protein, partial [Kofleriaceae bacterium]|nr:glycoside hydrolase family 15 protein [Kofleriaceae bacterium]